RLHDDRARTQALGRRCPQGACADTRTTTRQTNLICGYTTGTHPVRKLPMKANVAGTMKANGWRVSAPASVDRRYPGGSGGSNPLGAAHLHLQYFPGASSLPGSWKLDQLPFSLHTVRMILG